MNNLIIPDGKVTGCLPRTTRFGECCSPMSDRIHVIEDDDAIKALIGKISLRPFIEHVFDQDGVGSCAAEGSTQPVQLMMAWNGRTVPKLSPWSVYCFTCDGRDQGSSIDDNLVHIRDVGVLTMETWPRSKGWNRKPPESLLADEAAKYRIDEFFDIGSIAEVRTALVLGYPVTYGWKGHCCLLVELKDLDTAFYLNSWGEDWGDHGVGEIKLREIDFRYGAFAVRSVVDAGGA